MTVKLSKGDVSPGFIYSFFLHLCFAFRQLTALNSFIPDVSTGLVTEDEDASCILDDVGTSSVDIDVTIGFLLEETTNGLAFVVVITDFPGAENPVDILVTGNDATIRTPLDVEILFDVIGESIFCDVVISLLMEEFLVSFVSDENIVVPKEYGIMRDGVNFEV